MSIARPARILIISLIACEFRLADVSTRNQVIVSVAADLNH